jgi:hypothetical protein
MRPVSGENVLLSLWVGGMWAIGYIAVPVLFATIEDKTVAGAVAGRLFTISGWVGFCAAGLLALLWLIRLGSEVLKTPRFPMLLLAVGLLLVNLLYVQPQIISAHQLATTSSEYFALLHRAAGVIYMLVSVIGLGLVAFSGHQPEKIER